MKYNMLALIIVIISLIFFLYIAGRVSLASSDKLPDLVAEISVPSKTRAGANIGQDMKLFARNIGKAIAPGTIDSTNPSGGYMIDLVLSTDETTPRKFAIYSPKYSEDVLLRGGRISRTKDIAPEESKEYLNGRWIIPADAPAGNYFICVQIDAGAKLIEANEENNISCLPIEIEGL